MRIIGLALLWIIAVPMAIAGLLSVGVIAVFALPFMEKYR